MNVWESLSGVVKVELTGAEITKSMERISNLGIEIKEAVLINSLCVQFVVSQQAFPLLKRVLTARGDTVRALKREGIYWTIVSILMRPVLIVGLFLLVWSSLYIPNHIYFVQIQGNQRVSAAEILSAAEDCGVYFGAASVEIRSESVKNKLLESMPQLQWAAINTRGCVATIQVREREIQPNETGRSGYGSIVAMRDGVVTQCVVFRGNLTCKPGQAVREGDVLISGYTDCGLLVKYTEAEGEILAQTKRELDVVSPDPQVRVMSSVETYKEFGLRIGKNIIIFSKDSGISGMSCGKMYEEKYVELPGGFLLPIAWVCQTNYVYEIEASTTPNVARLEHLTDAYLKSQMVGGTILSRDITHFCTDGATRLYAQYSCREMIGRKSDKEILQKYGQTD